MGYRLEVYKAEYKWCGGKLFGYVDEEFLPQLKSWQWLKKGGYIDEDNQYLWTYGVDHVIALFGDSYKEFIKIYIEDYKKYGYNDPIIIKELEESLKCKDDDYMFISWE